MDNPELNNQPSDIKHLENAANEATETEHSLTVREAFKIYPWAVFWSVIFCLAIIMDAYDTQLITNLYGLPAFAKKYGEPYNGSYIVPARWQTAFAMCAPVGRIVGGVFQGWLAEAFGRKMTLLGCLASISGFIFITFFSESNAVLLVGLMLCGVVWGIITSLAPTYASEICPLRLRDLLTA
jgi:MFS transporter, SP family, general alpha glucoside:H+ symporter